MADLSQRDANNRSLATATRTLCPAFIAEGGERTVENIPARRISRSQLIPENVYLYQDPTSPFAPVRATEIDPVEACNHACDWCFTKPYRNAVTIPNFTLAAYLRAFRQQGGVALHFSGGGEPLIAPSFRKPAPEFDNKTVLEFACSLGLSVGIITNGAKLQQTPNLGSLPSLAFLRVSLDASNASDHAARHQCSPRDFPRIVRALADLAHERGNRITPALGVSAIVDPSRRQFVGLNELQALRDVANQAGVDFVQLKHVHAEDECAADLQMLRVWEATNRIDWGTVQPWVQRYRSARSTVLCAITGIIETLDAQNRSFPCCHLYGQIKYRRHDRGTRSSRRVSNCTSDVCRYRSTNNVLTETRTLSAQSTLEQSLQDHGFHPYRLFPSSPELFA